MLLKTYFYDVFMMRLKHVELFMHNVYRCDFNNGRKRNAINKYVC